MPAPADSNANQLLVSQALERKLSKEIITPFITNNEFEGQISGPEDSVKILVAQAANVTDYTGGTVPLQDDLDALNPTLEMDHKKAFNFVLSPNTNLRRYIQGFTNESFNEVLQQAETYALSKADPALTGEMTAGDLTYDASTDSIADVLSEANARLSDNGVPVQGRFVVLPSLTAADAYDVVANRDTARGDVADEMGMIGMFRGLRIYEAPTDHFPTSGAGNEVAHFGHRGYHHYANAVVEVDVRRAPNVPGTTDNQVIGVHVAGSKISQSDAFGRIEIL